MQNELIQSPTATFEGQAQRRENGVEYWLARAEKRSLHNPDRLQDDE